MKHHPSFESLKHPFAITIGNFDGVHRGHAAILKRLREVSDHILVITFTNHPSEVLQKKPTRQIMSFNHRLALLETFGITDVIAIPFTESFSRQTAEDFLTELKKKVPFAHLILGHDAAIGYKREGDATLLSTLAEKLQFSLEYLEPVQLGNQVISSRTIRTLLRDGDLTTAQQMLGRPYSILGKVLHGAGFGKPLGFPTANLSVEGLEIPPFGIYAVEVIFDHATHLGVADLGVAPTMHTNRLPYLEVHILDFDASLYDKEIEVRFLKYLRPEIKFSSLEELTQQIEKDIEASKSRSLS